jgi:uncharacterized protein GlcG (DUF336 family)
MSARLRVPFVLTVAVAGIALGGCDGSNFTSAPVTPFFGDVLPLTPADVELIIARAVAATNSANVHVAVVDRTGLILGAYSTDGGVLRDEDNIAASIARTTAFFSNSQAPLSSRTVETLATFHFPPTFDVPFVESAVPVSTSQGGPASAFPTSVIAPTRTTTGIAGTPQGPLWQLNSTNRGAQIATALTNPPTAYNDDPRFPDPFFGFAEFLPSVNIDATAPSPGITLLPGAVPLYKANSTGVLRQVGGIGVYIRNGVAGDPLVDAAEFCAIEGASGRELGGQSFFFDAIPLEGAITIVGILLPYVKQVTRPAAFTAGTAPGPVGVDPGWLVLPSLGQLDPFDFLIGPRAGVDGGPTQVLTLADVNTIIAQVVASADRTRAQVRLPLGSAAKVIATIVDTRGLILAHFRQEDSLCDAVDVVPAKARSVVYFCRPGGPFSSATTRTLTNGQVLDFPNGDAWPGFPVDPTGQNRGIALTTRTLGFLSQPFYPPGIEGTGPGPLLNLARLNQEPEQFERWGNAPPDPGYQNGLTFFPGSVPLYKNGELVGALGVSGDGVEQNDLIAFEGGAGFEPPPELRIDNFTFQGVRLPYLKFPETPR